MSEEGDKKLYAHYTALVGGSFKSGNPVRDELIVSDAKKHLADLIKKRPNIQFEETTPKENIEASDAKEEEESLGEAIPKTKSKEKK